MTLENGAAKVTIREINNHGHAAFMLEYRWGGVRKQKVRADEAEAHADARSLLAMMLDEAPKFSDTEGAGILKSAECALTGFGVPVDVACREYAGVLRALNGWSLADAVALALRHKPVRTGKNIPALVEDYLAGLRGEVSPVWYQVLSGRLRRFARTFEGPVGDVAKGDMEEWLRGLSLSNCSRNNERLALVGFFRWARSEKYLPPSLTTEAEEIKVLKVTLNIEIFDLPTVERLMRHLEKKRPDLLPYAAVGIFGGVRPAELARLDFTSIRWEHGDIEIRADESKTNTRRLVEMQPNLKAWLAPYRGSRGPLAVKNAARKIVEVAKSIGIEWSSDVMRHSFISYGVAMMNQVGAVALWAGNSEKIIKRHYLRRVTADEGRAFFAINPKGAKKVVHFAEAA